MTIIQMQQFRAVCKFESFSKAAEEQYITQPAMSAAMKDLERECGVALFKRNNNALQITDEGYVLLEEITTILHQYDQLQNIVSNMSLERKYIRVGLSTLSGNTVFPKLCYEFQKRYPDIQILPYESSTKKQLEMLDKNKLDVIITVYHCPKGEEASFNKAYKRWPLKLSGPVFCVSVNHHLAAKKEVTIEEMSQENLVLMQENYNLTENVRKMFNKFGFEPKLLHSTSQMYTVERFVEANVAAGFLPYEVAENNPLIVGLKYPDQKISYVELFWKKDKLQFDATKKLIALAQELHPKEN